MSDSAPVREQLSVRSPREVGVGSFDALPTLQWLTRHEVCGQMNVSVQRQFLT